LLETGIDKVIHEKIEIEKSFGNYLKLVLG